MLISRIRSLAVVLLFPGSLAGQRSPSVTSPIRDVIQPVLIAPGSEPFHLEAVITTGREQSPYAHIEMDWLAPRQFRRVIHASDFSQTLVVSDDKTSEVDSGSYFPLELRTLVTAMVDPRPILAAVRDGDRVLTKANGAVNESGISCIGPTKSFCFKDVNGLRETVAASGHSVDFSQYETFAGKRVARTLTNAPRLGEGLMTLKVLKLEKLRQSDPPLFTATSPTPPSAQLRFAAFSESELRQHEIGSPQITWPQPLDGAEHGPASFFVSIDREGAVREVKQLYTANERTNESAISQISKWRFTPFTQEGLPTQAEGVLSFTLDTRAFGPRQPLSDAEARKLASNIVPPAVDASKYPKGTTYSLAAAVDSEGRLIEVIAGDGPHELFMPCYDSIRKWQFHPFMADGHPEPYRAILVFPIN